MTDATPSPPSSAASVDSTTSAETSFGSTPVRSITPVGTVAVSARECSGTIIARPHWDSTLAPPTRKAEASGSTSTDNSRPETETEDDGDVDMDRNRADTSPERAGNPPQTSHTRRAVGIITNSPPATTTRVSVKVNGNARVIIDNGSTHGLVKLESRMTLVPSSPTTILPWIPSPPGAIEGAAPTTAPVGLETRPRPGQPDVNYDDYCSRAELITSVHATPVVRELFISGLHHDAYQHRRHHFLIQHRFRPPEFDAPSKADSAAPSTSKSTTAMPHPQPSIESITTPTLTISSTTTSSKNATADGGKQKDRHPSPLGAADANITGKTATNSTAKAVRRTVMDTAGASRKRLWFVLTTPRIPWSCFGLDTWHRMRWWFHGCHRGFQSRSLCTFALYWIVILLRCVIGSFCT